MTTSQMNAELLRQLSIIAEDESMMKRALRALKRITAPQADATRMSKAEYFDRLNRASQEESITFNSVEAIDRYIQAL